LFDVIAMAVAFSLLLAFTAWSGGVDLAAPADPSAAYDARPLWYFRWLFQLRAMFGSLEHIIALVAPALVAGLLVALPLAERSPVYDPGTRKLWLGLLAGTFAVIGVLTVMSFAADADDAELAKREHKAEMQAGRARALAAKYGMP